MKKKEWNEGLNHIDPDLVEKYVEQKDRLRQKNKKPKGVWLRLGAIAACFVMILSAVIVVPMLREDDPGIITPPDGTSNDIGVNPGPGTTDDDNRPNIPIVNVQVPSSAPQYYGNESTPSVLDSSAADIATDGISVTARIISILPDTYTFYDDWGQKPYRIIEFEVLRVLRGINMTDSFYFLIPERYMTDFSKYDCFVIKDMGMFGYDHSVLYNQTDGCAEQFDKVIFGSLCTDANYIVGENFKAFKKDGYFDVSLWNANDAWKRATQWIFDYTNPYDSDYTLKQAEEDAKDGFDGREVVLLNTLTGDAATALDFAKNFDNGLFIPDGRGLKLFYVPHTHVTLHRYIGGFATNESVTIFNSDSASWSAAHFSEDDLQKLPDLQSAVASVISALEAGEIMPPHLKNVNQDKLQSSGVFGWYAKTDNGVIGVIRVSWYYKDTALGHYEDDCYFDDAYYIIEYGSDECVPIDKAALSDRIGADYEKSYIYAGEYDEYGKVRDMQVPMP